MSMSIAGISSTVTHAPSTNFAISTMTVVAPVAIAPSPLMNVLCSRPFARGPFLLSQCRTIPACESVKARNAPTANSGIRRSVIPPKTMSNRPAEHTST